MSTRSSSFMEKIAGAGLLLLFVVVGIIYSAMLPAAPRFPDEGDYVNLSHQLVHGVGFSLDGVHLTASRPPGYPYFLAGLESLCGGYFCFRVVQFFLLGATVYLVYGLCFGKNQGASLLVVTGVVLCYPALFYTGGTLYPQTLTAFLFLLALSLSLRDERSLGLNFATGLSYGMLMLVNPPFLLTMLIVLIAGWMLRLIRGRDALVMVLVAALVLCPWTARNAVVFHRFVPFASNSGLNLLMGNHEGAVATQGVSNAALMPFYLEAQRRNLDEFESDRFFHETAVSWIKAHPGDALKLYLEKVLNFFNIWNEYAENHAPVSMGKQVAMAASYLLLLGLLGWRLIEMKRYPLTSREILFLAIYVLSAFTAAIFVTRIRYRLPYDYLIIAVVAGHIGRRLESWRRESSP